MCTKQKFTKIEANTIISRIKKKKNSRRRYRREKRSYYCLSCNSWHLTSTELEVDIFKDKTLTNIEQWTQLLKAQ